MKFILVVDIQKGTKTYHPIENVRNLTFYFEGGGISANISNIPTVLQSSDNINIDIVDIDDIERSFKIAKAKRNSK